MPPKTIFRTGEKVLCFRGPLLYEATCVKSSTSRGKIMRYYLEYIGQDKNWDGWTPEDTVIKYNDANLRRQKELKREYLAQSAPPQKTSAKTPESEAAEPPRRIRLVVRAGRKANEPAASTSAGLTKERNQVGAGSSPVKKEAAASAAQSKKRPLVTGTSFGPVKLEPKTSSSPVPSAGSIFNLIPTSTPLKPEPNDNDTQRDTAQDDVPYGAFAAILEAINYDEVLAVHPLEILKLKVSTSIKLPVKLKESVLDDCILIKTLKKLPIIPARYSVAQIIDNYIAFRRLRGTNLQEDVEVVEVLGKLKGYFNTVLKEQLLYNIERPQYEAALDDYPGTPEAQLFGIIHLMRLFCRIQPFLFFYSLPKNNFKHIEHLQKFIKYFLENLGVFWQMIDYKDSTPQYRAKAEC